MGEGFDRFWAAYPNKTAKAVAAKAFAKLAPDAALLDTMLAALARQREWPRWQRDEGQYIPNPSTWLNQRRWEDRTPETPAPVFTPRGRETARAAAAWLQDTEGS